MITETCLIGHGIPSVSNDELVERWPLTAPLGMILDGKIELLSMEEFVPFRGHAWPRYDYFKVDNIPLGANAYLTASGTMKAAELLGLRWAVSAGLGGIYPKLQGESVCADIYALGNSPVKLMATAFKDMMDYEATFGQLRSQGSFWYFLEPFEPGYIFKIDATIHAMGTPIGTRKGGLFLRCIPEEKRIHNLELLARGIAYGHEMHEAGQHFHPAVNGFFDRETNGYSSLIQFEAIVSNVEFLLQNSHL